MLGARAGACERRTLVAGQIRSERRSRRPTSHPSPITTRAGSITRKAAARNPIANAGTSNDAARWNTEGSVPANFVLCRRLPIWSDTGSAIMAVPG